MGRKGKGGVARSLKKADEASAATASVDSFPCNRGAAGQIGQEDIDESVPTVGAVVRLRGLKTERLNEKYAVVDDAPTHHSSLASNRLQLSLFVGGDDGGNAQLDASEPGIAVKASNVRVVCGCCFAPNPTNRCSRCKVSNPMPLLLFLCYFINLESRKRSLTPHVFVPTIA